MIFYLDKEQLTALGFKILTPAAYITSAHSGDRPKEEWECNNVILTIHEKEGHFYCRLTDKNSPEYTYGFQSHEQLKNILSLINQGKTINDLWSLEQELRQKAVEQMLELQKKRPYLEDYRYNDIGGSFFEINSTPGQKVYMTYEKHSTSAYYYSSNDQS